MTTLFPTQTVPDFLAEVEFHMRHIRGEYDHTVAITPMPTPRVRGRVMAPKGGGKSFVHIYNPSDYTAHKTSFAMGIKEYFKATVDFRMIAICFHVQYPKSTAKKAQVEGMPCKNKSDIDNYVKFVLDGMQESGVLANDSAIHSLLAKKVYTCGSGFISFSFR